jgi:hypothetical protein
MKDEGALGRAGSWTFCFERKGDEGLKSNLLPTAQDEDVQRQLQRRRSHDDQAQEQEARQVVQAAAMDIPKQAPAFRKALSMPASYSGPYGSPSSPGSPSSSGQEVSPDTGAVLNFLVPTRLHMSVIRIHIPGLVYL